MLPKKYRLKKKDDFQRVYKKGRFFSLGILTVNFTDNSEKYSRFGFAVGKSYSKSAVSRNMARRRLRSAAEKIIPEAVDGKDFIIGVRKSKERKPPNSSAVFDLLRQLFKKNNLLKK